MATPQKELEPPHRESTALLLPPKNQYNTLFKEWNVTKKKEINTWLGKTSGDSKETGSGRNSILVTRHTVNRINWSWATQHWNCRCCSGDLLPNKSHLGNSTSDIGFDWIFYLSNLYNIRRPYNFASRRCLPFYKIDEIGRKWRKLHKSPFVPCRSTN